MIFVKLVRREMGNGQAFALPYQQEVLEFQTALALHTASITEHISRYQPDSPYTPSKQASKEDTRQYGRL